jgi:exodeoxyribonuclease VII small subunit
MEMGDAPHKPQADEPTFESALTELQEVVRALEEGSLGLDESIARFERAISLLRRCYAELSQAEQKIELLSGFDRAGNAVTVPFDSAATLDGPNASPGKRRNKAKEQKAEPEPQEPPSLPEERRDDQSLF